MSLMCVRLEPVRKPDDVAESRYEAYELTVPLDSDGRLDLENWDESAPYCTICRHRRDGSVLHGHLTTNERGEWAFSYDLGEEGKEYIYRFASHVLKPGEELSITQSDGTDHFYRVKSVIHPLVFGK